MFIKSIIQRLCEQILELISSASSSFYTSSKESSLLNYPNNDDRDNDNEGDVDSDDNDTKQFRQWNEVVCSLFRRDGIANRTHSLISTAEQSSPCCFANQHRQQQQYDRSLGCGVTFLQHIQQDCTWDCGISCLEMVILWLTQSHNGTFDDKLNERDHSGLRSFYCMYYGNFFGEMMQYHHQEQRMKKLAKRTMNNCRYLCLATLVVHI
jgi:hypothetical protein